MNAKNEFIDNVEGFKIICAHVYDYGHRRHDAILKKGFSAQDYEEFLQKLDFEYDDGYGGQVLDGTIWLENGQWYDRGEYDGAEWWQLHSYPEIPESLL